MKNYDKLRDSKFDAENSDFKTKMSKEHTKNYKKRLDDSVKKSKHDAIKELEAREKIVKDLSKNKKADYLK